MKKTLAATAILALTATGVYAGNVQTFDDTTALPEVEAQPMGGSSAAWIVPLIAIIAIAASKGGNGGGDDDDEPIDPCTCKDVDLRGDNG